MSHYLSCLQSGHLLLILNSLSLVNFTICMLSGAFNSVSIDLGFRERFLHRALYRFFTALSVLESSIFGLHHHALLSFMLYDFSLLKCVHDIPAGK